MTFGSAPHPHSLCLRLLLSVSTIITISSFDFLLRSAPFLTANFGSLEQLEARKAHNLEVAGSSPAAATTDDIVNTPLFYQQKYLGNSWGISVICERTVLP